MVFLRLSKQVLQYSLQILHNLSLTALLTLDITQYMQLRPTSALLRGSWEPSTWPRQFTSATDYTCFSLNAARVYSTDVETVASETCLKSWKLQRDSYGAHRQKNPDMPEQGFHCCVSDISVGESSSADSDVIRYVDIRKLLYVFSTYFRIRAPRLQEIQRYGVNTYLSRTQRECMDKTPLY
jgi:hypothetical protein